MKNIFLFTTILCSSILTIKADLLNGPYSPESQELVKLVQNATMPIPEKFKDQKKEIATLRLFATINSLDPQIMMEMGRDLLNAPYNFHEAIMQMLTSFKSTIEQDDMNMKRYSPLTIDDLFIFSAAIFGFKINNEELFKSASQKANQRTKDDILGFLVDNATSINANLPQVKKYIEIAIKLGADPNGNFIDSMRPYTKIIKYYFPRINNAEKNDSIFDLLLKNGLNINAITYNTKTKKTGTFLDSFVETSKSMTDNQDIKDLVDYLRLKGAKTYAELTAAEKGQK